MEKLSREERIAENVKRFNAANRKTAIIVTIYFVLFSITMGYFLHVGATTSLGCKIALVIYATIAIFFLFSRKLPDSRYDYIKPSAAETEAEIFEFTVENSNVLILRQRIMNVIFTLICASITIFIAYSGIIEIHKNGLPNFQNQNDVVFTAMGIIFFIIFGYGALSSFMAFWILPREEMNFKNGGGQLLKISRELVSISPLVMIFDNALREKLAKENKSFLELPWGEIDKIVVRDQYLDNNRSANYEFHLKHSQSGLLKKLLSSYISVSRREFFGQESDIVEALRKFAKCQVVIKDKIR